MDVVQVAGAHHLPLLLAHLDTASPRFPSPSLSPCTTPPPPPALLGKSTSSSSPTPTPSPPPPAPPAATFSTSKSASTRDTDFAAKNTSSLNAALLAAITSPLATDNPHQPLPYSEWTMCEEQQQQAPGGPPPPLPLAPGVPTGGRLAVPSSSSSSSSPLLVPRTRAENLLAIVRVLLDRGRADPNVADASGTPVLMLAIRHRRSLPVVAALIDAGAAVSCRAQSESGATPLFFATVYAPGGSRILEYLIQQHATSRLRASPSLEVNEQHLVSNIHARDSLGRTPLLFAAEHGRADAIRTLLAGGANVRDVDKSGRTVLINAASKASSSVMRTLIDAGADVNAADSQGRTPLLVAIFRGALAIVRVLLSAGANPDVATLNGETAIGLAATMDHKRIVDHLLQIGADPNFALESATLLQPPLLCCRLSDGIFKALVDVGCDVNAVSHHGDTPLKHCARQGQLDRARVLLQSGANPRLGHPTCALSVAVRRGHVDMVKEFLAVCPPNSANLREGVATNSPAASPSAASRSIRGKPYSRERGGMPLLHIALENSLDEMALLLLERGADPRVADPRGYVARDFIEFRHACSAGRHAGRLFDKLRNIVCDYDHWATWNARAYLLLGMHVGAPVPPDWAPGKRRANSLRRFMAHPLFDLNLIGRVFEVATGLTHTIDYKQRKARGSKSRRSSVSSQPEE